MNSRNENEFAIYLSELLRNVIKKDHLWSKRIQK